MDDCNDQRLEMSKETLDEVLAMNPPASLKDECVSTSKSTDIEETSEINSEPLESHGDESSLKKESGDMFNNESDIEDSVSESNLGLSGTGSTASDFEDSVEDVFDYDSESLSDVEQEMAGSNKSSESHTVFEKDSSSSDKKIVDSFVRASGNEINTSTSAKQGGQEVPSGEDEKDAHKNEPQSSISPKSPQSPTEALKSLSISDSPESSAKKNTRQTRLRNKTINNIFDSPYNTRLKARMVRERELRSRSEGGSTKE